VGLPPEKILATGLILYTNLLSTVISNSSVNHHFYADDAQLFFSFSAADFAYNISPLEHNISNVYNWLSSNFNSSSQFLLLAGLFMYLLYRKE
jgi:hypothetical protein